ncbi:ATP-dependent DNA ligase [Fulvivirgaceae bacterium PWU5]|uniref:DNA ligase (ATP) n=1 Tax=Dawidia cretensis TaxID=2782350 RepID=A0AAP2DZG9_9BACT|nr:ATP-dependent DNA ligase [Dawidia cretensis]MBT1708649.1 ATP-dependent DNA ligase [Dawidia cretensis]
MKNFANLFTALDQTTKTLGKIDALVNYFRQAPDADKLWAMALLSHRRPKRTVNTTLLATWASAQAGLPLWLFEESYHVVGDLAETITLLLPPPRTASDESLTHWIEFIRALEPLTIEEKQAQIYDAWSRLDHTERFVFNKLITGGFRMGVSQQLMVKALAKHTGTRETVLAHKLMGNWTPDQNTFTQLLEEEQHDISRPYPFYLAYALEDDVATLGAPEEWYAEHKWDGIRGQIIVRDRQLFVWSRGEELVTDKYPEYTVMLDLLPDGTVLDGEILPFHEDRPLSFNHLQTRIGRKTLSTKLLREVPVAFVAYDVLEWEGTDLRERPMHDRRAILETICAQPHPTLRLSALVTVDTWEALAAERQRARELVSEGIMLKRKTSSYRTGRRRGDWWKWKIDPLTVDAVMIYAMHGAGRRANLYTDYTFAVWDQGQLVPFTKAYSGLTDDEIRAVDRWIKQNTLERFGPVRSVKPELVFEIAFEGIAKSTRHKSGIALRFPRIRRWRQDKPAAEADTLESLRLLLDER